MRTACGWAERSISLITSASHHPGPSLPLHGPFPKPDTWAPCCFPCLLPPASCLSSHGEASWSPQGLVSLCSPLLKSFHSHPCSLRVVASALHSLPPPGPHSFYMAPFSELQAQESPACLWTDVLVLTSGPLTSCSGHLGISPQKYPRSSLFPLSPISAQRSPWGAPGEPDYLLYHLL